MRPGGLDWEDVFKCSRTVCDRLWGLILSPLQSPLAGYSGGMEPSHGSQISSFDKWLVCSGTHLPPVWASKLLTVQILRECFRPCRPATKGWGWPSPLADRAGPAPPCWLSFFQSSATSLRSMWFLLRNQIPTKHLSLNLCFHNTCFIVKPISTEYCRCSAVFMSFLGCLLFLCFLFWVFFPLPLLVARVLNTWGSSLVVSIVWQFSE